MKKIALVLTCLAVVSAAAFGAVTATYLGTDGSYLGKTVEGNWVGNVGAAGYHLLYWGSNEDQKSYPSYLNVASRGGDFSSYQWQGPGSTTDARAATNAAQTERSASCWYTGGTGYIRIVMASDASFVLGVYMLDWDQTGSRNAELAVCDSTIETTTPAQVTTGAYHTGKWYFWLVSGAAGNTISIRVKTLASNATAAMLSFDPAGIYLSSFSVSDQTTGSTTFTGSAAVNVALEAGGDITGWQITESDVEPAEWLGAAPSTYTIATGEGFKTIYAWIKDAEGNVESASASIFYSTATPEILNVEAVPGGSSITVSWQTDVPALGWIQYGIQGGGLDMTTATTGPDTFHFIDITGLLDQTAYTLEIHSNSATQIVDATTTATEATDGAVTWAGRVPDDKSWARGSNWLDFQQPANPTAATVTFSNAGVGNTITTDGWEVGRLRFINPLADPPQTNAYAVDLDGSRLIVAGSGTGAANGLTVGGAMDQQRPYGTMDVTFSNGTLQIGQDGRPVDLSIAAGGWNSSISSTVTMASGTSLDAYLRDVSIGTSANPGNSRGTGVLDITNATLIGGELRARNLLIGCTETNPTGALRFSPSTGISLIAVTGKLGLGDGGATSGQSPIGSLGDPAAGNKLPPGVSLQVGDSLMGSRGSLVIGRSNWVSSTTPSFIAAQSGGTFDAYVTELLVGVCGGSAANFQQNGSLDVRNMTQCTIDAATMVVGRGVSAGARGVGQVYLPAGICTAGSLTVGGPASCGSGLLQLNGTRFGVTTSLTVNPTGTVETMVGGASCGLELASDATLAMTGAGKIHVVFAQPQSPEGAIYYGLKWEGDKTAQLQSFATSGNITWDSTAVEGVAGISYDSGTDATYVMLAARLPLTAAAKDITVEMAEGGSVVIAADDVDAGSVDPNGYTIVSYVVACPDDTVAGDDFVTLDDYGEFTVTLTVTNDNVPPELASDTCLVLVVPVPEPVLGDVVWSGGASTSQMERREWTWGANWQGGAPPDNPTSARVTFSNTGTGLTVVPEDWSVGRLRFLNTLADPPATNAYTVDLSASRLIADLELSVGATVNQQMPFGTMNVTVANGTLQIGNDGVPADLSIGVGGWNGSIAGTLTLEAGTSLEAWLRDVSIGTSANPSNSAGNGVLDITNATLIGGELRARNMLLGAIETKAVGSIRISPDTGVTLIDVAEALRLGDGGQGCVGWIGDPADGNRLPPGVTVTVGVEGAPGKLIVGRSTWYPSTTLSQITATSGGSLTAYVSELVVGQNTGFGSTQNGTLDVRNMTQCTIDATTMVVGKGTSAGARAVGSVYLPAGTGTVGSMTVGGVANSGSGLLQLNGTRVGVTAGITVDATGTVETIVGGTSCGLELAFDATLAINGAGKIHVVFASEQDPQGVRSSGSPIYYGLKWDGDKTGQLQSLAAAGRITWDNTATGGVVGISYDEATNATYVTLAARLPLTAVAKDITLEMAEGGTVIIAADDVDAGSSDPNGYNIVSYVVTSPDDTVPGDEFVTLNSFGDHTITLTVTNDNVPPESASDTCIVTIVLTPDPVAGDMVWTGGASTSQMPRREWTWGANWQGGAPPANPTGARVRFSNVGTGDTITTADWTVGSLRFLNPSASPAPISAYNVDLSNSRLIANTGLFVGGEMDQQLPYGTMNVTFSNGTLQVGQNGAPADLIIAAGGWNASIASTVTLTSGTSLEAYLRDLTIGTSMNPGNSSGDGVLDLVEATLVGGELRARNVLIGCEESHPHGSLRFSPATGISLIAVSGKLGLGDGNQYNGQDPIGWMGDPGAGNALPPGVSIAVGSSVTASRGAIVIGRTNWVASTLPSFVVASSGGTFDAYVTDLLVGVCGGSYGGTITQTGTLDVRNMDVCTIDANTVVVGRGASEKARAIGSVNLPAGACAAGNVTIGGPAGSGSGLLQLNGTAFAVSTALTVDAAGSVQTLVNGESCGLDLAAGAAVTVNDGGTISITFAEPATSGVYYGLKWAGDHQYELDALRVLGKLTWDDSLLPEPAAIFMLGGDTYVGVQVAVAKVTSFAVTDASSGSSLVTNAAAVAVAITAEPAPDQTIVGYVVNETGVEPAEGWQASVTGYTIQVASGSTATLYAFAVDSAGNVGSKSAAIYFNTAAPVVSNIVITDNADSDPPATGTVTVTWTTDIPAESSLKYGPVAMSGATPNTVAENVLATAHAASFPVTAGTNYKIVLVNTEIASPAIYWPKPWPIDGDSNQDCRVNILDLIFIRNKLNLDVTTGDNWKADVNKDTRINILDLIFVRNKLNTSCP